MERNRRINTHGAVLFLLLIVTLPGVAAEPPPSCMAYAYVMSQNEPHASLVVDDTYVFGTQLIVVSNCNNTEIYVDGILATISPAGSAYTYVNSGIHNVTIANDGFNKTYENVTFIQAGQLSMMVNNMPTDQNPHSTSYTDGQITSVELVSGIGSILISWLLVVGLLWKIIREHHDRHYCMEVV